jgi:hypothetical protein
MKKAITTLIALIAIQSTAINIDYSQLPAINDRNIFFTKVFNIRTERDIEFYREKMGIDAPLKECIVGIQCGQSIKPDYSNARMVLILPGSVYKIYFFIDVAQFSQAADKMIEWANKASSLGETSETPIVVNKTVAKFDTIGALATDDGEVINIQCETRLVYQHNDGKDMAYFEYDDLNIVENKNKWILYPTIFLDIINSLDAENIKTSMDAFLKVQEENKVIDVSDQFD